MLRHHMAVITRDSRLKREIQRLTAATGSTADFAADASGLSCDSAVDLAILDARTGDPDPRVHAATPGDSAFILLLDEQRFLDKLDVLGDDRVASLMCYSGAFDEDEFIASATKALRGTVFGLPKYFPWGVTTYTMVVHNYEEKNRAIEGIVRYGHAAGVRGPVRDRIQVVADELMMNALYHAPTDADGNERFRDKTVKELAQLPSVPPIEVQYGASGRYFGVSVRDGGGSLTRQRLVEHLRRARNATTVDDTAPESRRGLGLITVFRSVSKLVFNLDPGHSTEVIGLFDMDPSGKVKGGARSVHVFRSRPEPEQEEAVADEETPAVSLRPSQRGLLALAAALVAVVAALAVAVARRGEPAASLQPEFGRDPAAAAADAAGAAVAATPVVVLSPEPADARITVGGRPVHAGTPIPIGGDEAVVVTMEAAGYQAFEAQIERSAIPGAVTIQVPLSPQPLARRTLRSR